MDDIKDLIFSTPLLRVLDLLLQYGSRELSDAEIVRKVQGVKKSAVHNALTTLNRMGIIQRTHKGRRCYNLINWGHAWLFPAKIASNMLMLSPLIEQLKGAVSKIILFGSRADGTNRHDSDFDLFVIAKDSSAVVRIISKSPLEELIQAVIKSPEEMLDFEKREPVITKEIQRGIVLWEK